MSVARREFCAAALLLAIPVSARATSDQEEKKKTAKPAKEQLQNDRPVNATAVQGIPRDSELGMLLNSSDGNKQSRRPPPRVSSDPRAHGY